MGTAWDRNKRTGPRDYGKGWRPVADIWEAEMFGRDQDECARGDGEIIVGPIGTVLAEVRKRADRLRLVDLRLREQDTPLWLIRRSTPRRTTPPGTGGRWPARSPGTQRCAARASRRDAALTATAPRDTASQLTWPMQERRYAA